jgi:hypothetical protein
MHTALHTINPSNSNIQLAGRSPHNKAVTFLKEDSYAYMLEETQPQRFIERYVVVTFFYHFNGPEWDYQVGFLKGDVCSWYINFYIASGHKVREGITCEDTFVSKIILGKFQLTS